MEEIKERTVELTKEEYMKAIEKAFKKYKQDDVVAIVTEVGDNKLQSVLLLENLEV